MAKKNSKKNKFKSKDRFRNSIISNEPAVSVLSNKSETIASANNSIAANSVSSTRIQSLSNELKLIGIIVTVLVAILVITSFII